MVTAPMLPPTSTLPWMEKLVSARRLRTVLPGIVESRSDAASVRRVMLPTLTSLSTWPSRPLVEFRSESVNCEPLAPWRLVTMSPFTSLNRVIDGSCPRESRPSAMPVISPGSRRPLPLMSVVKTSARPDVT